MFAMIVGGLVFWGILALVGSYVSLAKHRPGIEGFLLTACLGPLGILIAALLPTVEAPKNGCAMGHPTSYKLRA